MTGRETTATQRLTFLSTDIEGSTRLYHRLGDDFEAIVDRHRVICRAVFTAADGIEIACHGDGFLVGFPTATAAFTAAVDAQRNLQGETWPEGVELRVRMALHTGEVRPTTTGGSFYGFALHEASRLGELGHGDQIIASQAAVDSLDGDLPTGVALIDLGAITLRDVEGEHNLYELQIADAPRGNTGPRELRRRASRVPVPADLVGRDADLARVIDGLAAGRVTTILGPGGVGKTSLAATVARSLSRERNPAFVSLTSFGTTATTDDVAEAIGSALDLRVRGGLDGLVHAARETDRLLVIDNCEHVIAAVATVVRSLSDAPSLSVLTTSRQALRVPNETVVTLEPLSPNDAAELFCQRAVAAGYKDCSPTDETVVSVCAALDRLPLAIELAAGRLQILTLAELIDGMAERFALLRSSEGVADTQHHATLEGSIAWSYDLLQPIDRDVLFACAIFDGTGDLDAVAGVADHPGADTLDSLQRLVDRSLTTVDRTSGSARFGLLESIRAFALSRAEPGALDRARDRHLALFAGRAFDALKRWQRGANTSRLGDVTTDSANLRAALRHAAVTGNAQSGLQIAAAWSSFAGELIEDHFEYPGLLDQLLDKAASAEPAVVAQALVSEAMRAIYEDEGPRARAMLDELAARYETELADDGLRAQVLHAEGSVSENRNPIRMTRLAQRGGATLEGDDVLPTVDSDGAAVAVTLHRQAADLAEQSGLLGFRVFVLSFLASAAVQSGQIDLARSTADIALAEARRLGHLPGIARSLQRLGQLALLDNNPALARSIAAETIATAMQSGSFAEAAVAHVSEALACYLLGEEDAALEHNRIAVGLLVERGRWLQAFRVLAGAATLILAGRPSEAPAVLQQMAAIYDLAGGDTPATRLAVAGVLPAAEKAGYGNLVRTMQPR